MKTSINVDQWLVDKVKATCPGVPFGTLARDALLIALPHWEQLGPDKALQIGLMAELRLVEATAAQMGVTLPEAARRAMKQGRHATPATPVPDDPQARPRRADGRWMPKTVVLSGHDDPPVPEPARSRRPAKPSAGSNGVGESVPAAVERIRRAAKTRAATATPANPAK